MGADPGDGRFLGHVIDETLRQYPLFGVAHRITSAEIEVDEGASLPSGSVLCFNYPQFQRAGFADPDRFDPDRWLHILAKDTNFIPFGIASNRPCPAWHLAPVTLAALTREVLARFDLRTSARHTRSIPNRGPCLLVPRAGGLGGIRIAASLGYLRLRDRVEDVWRSLAQLGFGSYMVWDARRQSLCTRQGARGCGRTCRPDRRGADVPGWECAQAGRAHRQVASVWRRRTCARGLLLCGVVAVRRLGGRQRRTISEEVVRLCRTITRRSRGCRPLSRQPTWLGLGCLVMRRTPGVMPAS